MDSFGLSFYVRTSRINLWLMLGFAVLAPVIVATVCCKTQETHVNISGYEHKTGFGVGGSGSGPAAAVPDVKIDTKE